MFFHSCNFQLYDKMLGLGLEVVEQRKLRVISELRAISSIFNGRLKQRNNDDGI